MREAQVAACPVEAFCWLRARLRSASFGVAVFAHLRFAKTGGADRDQTDDLVVANDALYQLSYWPMRNVTYWEIVARK